MRQASRTAQGGLDVSGHVACQLATVQAWRGS